MKYFCRILKEWEYNCKKIKSYDDYDILNAIRNVAVNTNAIATLKEILEDILLGEEFIYTHGRIYYSLRITESSKSIERFWKISFLDGKPEYILASEENYFKVLYRFIVLYYMTKINNVWFSPSKVYNALKEIIDKVSLNISYNYPNDKLILKINKSYD